MDPRIEKLFKEYEKAFSSLDVKKNASFYADTVISAGPDGFIITQKKDLVATAKSTADYYRSIGLTSIKMKNIEEAPICAEYSSVKVEWEATRYEKGKKSPFLFTVSYIIKKNQERPVILLFIAHQDQEDVLRLLGVE